MKFLAALVLIGFVWSLGVELGWWPWDEGGLYNVPIEDAI